MIPREALYPLPYALSRWNQAEAIMEETRSVLYGCLAVLAAVWYITRRFNPVRTHAHACCCTIDAERELVAV